MITNPAPALLPTPTNRQPAPQPRNLKPPWVTAAVSEFGAQVAPADRARWLILVLPGLATHPRAGDG